MQQDVTSNNNGNSDPSRVQSHENNDSIVQPDNQLHSRQQVPVPASRDSQLLQNSMFSD